MKAAIDEAHDVGWQSMRAAGWVLATSLLLVTVATGSCSDDGGDKQTLSLGECRNHAELDVDGALWQTRDLLPMEWKDRVEVTGTLTVGLDGDDERGTFEAEGHRLTVVASSSSLLNCVPWDQPAVESDDS